MSGRESAPPSSVTGALSLEGTPVPLAGGEGRSWRVGDAVLKPLDVSVAQLEWQANLFVSLHGSESLRLPLPIRSTRGELAVDGWFAMTFLEGPI